jgi:glycosyltransferase involved in cell wall biosynthesis
MNKKKIIQITSFYPPHLGGMEYIVRELSERLAERGHEIEVFTSDIGCGKEKRKSGKNIKVNYLRNIFIAHTPIMLSLLFRLMKVSENSVLHVHIAPAFVPEITYLVHKIKKVPFVAHVHLDVGPSGKMGFLLPLYKKIFLQRVLRSAAVIVVPSYSYVELVSEKYSIPENKIIRIPCGIDLNNFSANPGRQDKTKKLLFVGRLTVQKNIPLLIESFKKIIEKGFTDIELNIVGDGEEKEKITELIRKEELEQKIIMLGELSGRGLYKIYANSDIFVFTSGYESFGIVLIEAMASGLPIVSTDIPAVRDIIKNGFSGLLVCPNPVDVSNAVVKLLEDTLLRETIIQNGLSEVKKYDWDVIIKRFEKVYENI